MKIRWIGPPVDGGFHNNPLGVRRGQVIDTDGPDYLITETSLHDYLASHLAEKVGNASKVDKAVEKAVMPEQNTETATRDVPPEVLPEPEPLDEDDEKPLSASATKRHKVEDAAAKKSEEADHFPDKEFIDDLPEPKRPPRRPRR
jgi:hypothetical protein